MFKVIDINSTFWPSLPSPIPNLKNYKNMITPKHYYIFRALRPFCAALALTASFFLAAPAQAGVKEVTIIPPDAKFHGKTYPEWQAAAWQYAFALPVEGHPFLDPNAEFSAAQNGSVWFGSLDVNGTREVNLPQGKALFLMIRAADGSSLEAPPFFGATEDEQRAVAEFFADHIVDVFVEINGEPVPNLDQFRFATPQFTFTAPTPWVFGEVGGTGTAVGEGYTLLLQLPKGVHTIHYGGTFHFDAGELDVVPIDIVKDITLIVTVGN